jgi:ADP-heptose:LPS heptosyltransferase
MISSNELIKSLKSLVRQILPGSIVRAFESILRTVRKDVPEIMIYLPFLARYFVNVRIRRKRLLVVERSWSIGDLVCLLSCIRGLRERHPNAWLAMITPHGCSQLAMASGLCDAASDTQSMSHRFLRQVCSPGSYYRPLLPDERRPAKPRSRLHLADEFARVLSTNSDLDSVKFIAPDRVRRRMIQRLRGINPEGRPIIVVHPGPSWPVKEWPIERWSELVEKVSPDGSVIIHIGADYYPFGRRVPARPIPKTISWINMLDLTEMVALLEHANVFVGIDSGPLHIATALGIPSVGLFGPTEGRLIMHPRARATVATGIASCLGCHHALTGPLHWITGCPNDIVCMREITSDQVLSAVSCALALGRTQ